MNIKEMGEKIGLDEDEYLELIELFIETSQEYLELLEAAMEKKDLGEVKKNAHLVTGAAANLGLWDMHAPSQQIERYAEMGETLDCMQTIVNLKAAFEDLKSTVDALTSVC